MKRVISLSMILVTFATAATSNAQFFVEGSVGAGYNAGQSLFGGIWETPTNIYFNVSPLAGYRLNNKMAVGAKASFVRIKQKIMVLDSDTGDEVQLVRRAPEWSIAIFGRYKLLGSKKISFLVEGSAYISEIKRIDKSTSLSVYKSNESEFTIGINILPLVTYDLSDRWSIIAAGDFLSLDLSTKTEKFMNSGIKDKRNHFGFKGQSTLFKRGPEFKIGVICHFNKSRP